MGKYLIFLIIFASALYFGLSIKFSNFECRGNNGSCSREVADILTSALPLKITEVKNSLRESIGNSPMVESYSYQFNLPNTLEVYVIEKKPSFVVFDTSTSHYHLIDKKGDYIMKTEESDFDFPMINVSSFSTPLGDFVGNNIFFALKVIQKVGLISKMKQANVDNWSLQIDLEEGIKATFPLEGDIDYLGGAFFLIISQLNKDNNEFRIDNKRVSEIDFRFRNPVIKS